VFIHVGVYYDTVLCHLENVLNYLNALFSAGHVLVVVVRVRCSH